jgi:hypothetical protein
LFVYTVVNTVNIGDFVKIRLQQVLDKTRNGDLAPSRSCKNRRSFSSGDSARQRVQITANHT